MPQPNALFSNEDLDSLLATGGDTGAAEYESFDLDDDLDGEGNPITTTTTSSANPTPAAPNPDLSNYLANDLRLRQEEAQRRQTEEAQRRQNEAQERARQAREQRMQDLDARLNTAFPSVTEPTLTEAERQQFQQSLPMIERMAQYHAARTVGGMRDTFREVMARNMELEDQLSEVRASTQANPRQQLDVMVRAQVPDIDATLQDPQWSAFRDTVIPSLGVTPGQIIQNHYANGNAQGVVGILNSFKSRSKTTRTETPAPGMPSASGPSTKPVRGKMLKYTDLNQAYARHQSGTLSYDKLQGIVNKFEEAAAEGRVDYDK